MSSNASAQIASRCGEDAVSVADGPGRNAWAANCGYISPSSLPFLDAESVYLVFTTGCGHAGCNPFVPVVATAPCIFGLTSLEYCFHDESFVLGVSSTESGINVSSAGRVDRCPDGGACNFSYFWGTTLTVAPTSTRNTVDCLQFAGWQGACAGQGSTCSLVVHGNLSTTASWSRINGCIPR